MRGFLILAVFLAGFSTTSANARPATHVYLFRGLANVFSTGMDSLAAELQARGYDASVYSHVSATGLAAQAAQTQKRDRAPIVIIGHSLGGNAAYDMARVLQTYGARVALIVTFGTTSPDSAPSNVSRVINYYQAHSVVNATIAKGPGFRGSLSNVNLDNAPGVNHLNIEKIASLHAQTISAIASVSRQSAAPVARAPSVAHASASAGAN